MAAWLPRVSSTLVLSLAACSASSEPDGPLARSSVLLITLDTTRADALGCYGGPQDQTPNLDRLASEGIRFGQARSVAPVTLPAHASMLTGEFPFEHGVRDNATFRLSEKATTLAEHLQSNGYFTAAVMGSFVLHSDFGLDQGFDVYSDVPRRQLEQGSSDDQRRADEVVDEALRILSARDRENPFFLWVHFFDPHWPYDPPPAFMARALRGAPAAAFSEDELARKRYGAEVAFLDSQLGRLSAGVRSASEPHPLLSIAVADHGEGLGDHREPTHGLQLYDTTLSVPLIVHHPDLPKGLVVSEPVSVVDLTPTVLAMLGFDATDLSGSNLLPLIEGRAGEIARPLYVEACAPYYTNGWAPLFGLVEDGLKLIEGPRPELYAVGEDPAERRNQIEARPEAAGAMRARFSELVPRTRESERVTLDESQRDSLAALGYVGPTGPGPDERPLAPGAVLEGLRDPREGLPIQRLVAEAMGLKQAGQLEEAARTMRQVVQLDPDNPLYLSNAGEVFMAAGLTEKALEVLTRSIELREEASTRCALAQLLLEAGRAEDGIAHLRLNAKLHPRHLQTRLVLGEALLHGDDLDEAVVHLEAFLEEHASRDALHARVTELVREARKGR